MTTRDGEATGRWDLLGFLAFMALLVMVVVAAPSVLAAEHPVRILLLVIGYASELMGLAMALVGLHRTWTRNAPGHDLFPRVTRAIERISDRPRNRDEAALQPRRPVAELVLDGIPLAVKGLALMILGVLLQAFGHGLPT